MNRILIKENNHLLGQICNSLNKYHQPLNELKTAFDSLEIGEFNNEIFQELIINGTAKIESTFVRQLNEMLDKMDVSNSMIRKNLTEGKDNLMFNLKNKLKELKSFVPPRLPESFPRINLDDISYLDGEFKIVDKEVIAERYCRIYLDNEIEKNAFDCLQIIADNINKLNQHLAESHYPDKAIAFNYLHKFLKGPDNCEIDVDGFKAAITFGKRKKEFFEKKR